MTDLRRKIKTVQLLSERAGIESSLFTFLQLVEGNTFLSLSLFVVQIVRVATVDARGVQSRLVNSVCCKEGKKLRFKFFPPDYVE